MNASKNTFTRSSGVLMHISSLPGDYGIGDFGKGAYKFVDFLVTSGQKLWQVLPLGPTGYGDSPYQSFSTFAGNPYFISLDELLEEGYLTQGEIDIYKKVLPKEGIDYGAIYDHKLPLLNVAYDKYLKKEGMAELERYLVEEGNWLEDYALFMALKNKFSNKSWRKWPREYKFRDKETIKKAKEELKVEIFYYVFLQYFFKKQWLKLKEYANSKDIKIIGDIPIFVAEDSSDLWADDKVFLLDSHKNPKAVAGCPPDAFSKDGQHWGNPLYNWKYLRKTGYEWWIKRIQKTFELTDIVRIDHFRGIDSYWRIPADAKTAKKGTWTKGPGIELFRVIEKRLGDMPIIAEDLGFLTPSVKKLLKRSGFPGMKILQFAFDSRDTNGENDYLPENYPKNSVAYAGTHDNDTIVGWYEDVAKADRAVCDKYLKNHKKADLPIHWALIELLWESNANLVVVQTQDLLGLGREGRMNIPATASGNWVWRLTLEELDTLIEGGTAKRLKELTVKSER